MTALQTTLLFFKDETELSDRWVGVQMLLKMEDLSDMSTHFLLAQSSDSAMVYGVPAASRRSWLFFQIFQEH